MADVRAAIRSQYLAALAMLGQTIERCPDELWTAPAPTSPLWYVACHALFYTHLYLAPTEADFVPWPKYPRDLDPTDIAEPYSRADMLEYLAFCREQVIRRVPELDLDAPSGFHWLPFDKLELQLYNIRHVQQHAGELAERLVRAGVDTSWVGRG